MLAQCILFMVGILGVYIGAEWLVKGSSNLSRELGIRPIIIGLTVVAFGTSSPELAVSLTASIKESDEIAIGNIIGSNIANIGLVLGVSALVFPLKVERIIMKSELPLMIAISAALYLMAIDKEIGFVDGLFLFTGIILFTGYQIYSTINLKQKSSNLMSDTNMAGLANKQSSTKRKKLFLNILFIVVGLASLLIGAHLLVKTAIFIAGRFGISEMVIGLTAVAFGTSVPEMATSVVSAFRKEAELCVGNVIGSNIFNILMVIGSVALIRPLNVTQETIFFELPVMLLFSIALIPMMRGTLAVNRIEGFILAMGYFTFIVLLFR
ncbi:MAG: calcium/sodium antiporter [Candidatus Scalinduaceae bacterium]